MAGAGGGMGPMAMAPPRGDHDHGAVGGGAGKAAAAPPRMSSMMHMAFFSDYRAVVLFPGWPGTRGYRSYILCLLFVLALATLTEGLAALSRCIARRNVGRAAGGSTAALLTAAHAARMGMAYLVMLAVMSFNVGVLLAAVAGHALGFFLARSRVHPAAAARAAAAARDRGELGGLPNPDGSKP
ncbi:hypothetical protein ACP70R_011794 [Stipagrostis hirtigluma subsp. patula]